MTSGISCLGGEVGSGSSAESLIQNDKRTDTRKMSLLPEKANTDQQSADQLTPLSGGLKQTLAAAIACLLPLTFGQCVGWTSPVQPLLESDYSPVGRLSSDEVSWLASLTFIGGMVGCFLWGRLSDWFGRKGAALLSAIPAALGCALVAFSQSPELLLLGRFLGGLAGSGALILTPLYIAEIAQDRLRGALGSMVVLAVNSGIVLSYLIGAALPYKLFNYACFAAPLIFVILFMWVPETPQYLWSKGRKAQAEASILWLRSGNVKCLEETLEFSCNKEEEEGVSFKSLFNTKGKRRGMLIGLGLFTWQQFCGILAILSYTSFIFHKSGSALSPERATIIVGIIQLLSSFLSSMIVERSGRKLLLLISYIFMGIALTVIGFYFYLEKLGFDVSAFSWVPVASLSLHVLTYALGAGPVPYVVISETLPCEIRGLASSTIVFWGTLLAFVSVKIFPLLVHYTQLYGCFWFFSIFCYLGFIFTWMLVPETKGIPVHVILQQLNGERFNGAYNSV